MSYRRQGFFFVLAIIAILAILWAARTLGFFWGMRDPVHAKTTEARMLQLMSVLEAEQPQRLDAESLRPLLEKYHRSECLTDDWDRPFLITLQQRGGKPFYTITSLGRDGRRGPCCRARVESWDDDAVLAGPDWVQVWNPHGGRADR
jgi:hypothetical protein